MNRGLKLGPHAQLPKAGQINNLAPMNRGLKPAP